MLILGSELSPASTDHCDRHTNPPCRAILSNLVTKSPHSVRSGTYCTSLSDRKHLPKERLDTLVDAWLGGFPVASVTVTGPDRQTQDAAPSRSRSARRTAFGLPANPSPTALDRGGWFAPRPSQRRGRRGPEGCCPGLKGKKRGPGKPGRVPGGADANSVR